MKRIIEILKEIEINQDSISIQYLVNKFGLTARTIQNDIKYINKLFSNYGTCKITFRKNKLDVNENDNIEKVIEKILLDLTVITNDFNLNKIYELILFFINNKNYTSYEKLITFFKIDKYSLKQKIELINNSFYYYSLNLRLVFKQKIGWKLKGNEIDLRFIAQNILINQEIGPRYLKEYNLYNLFNVLEEKLVERNFDNRYFITDLIWFLAIWIKRIAANHTLNENYFNLDELVKVKQINNDLIELISLLENTFNLIINNYETHYLNMLLCLTHNNNNLKLMANINSLVNNLIINKYKVPIKVKLFQKNLWCFFKYNFSKIYYNFYSLLSFEVVVFPFPLISKNLYEVEVINILEFVLQQFSIANKTNLKLNVNLWKVSHVLFEENKVNCKIPLFYIQNDFDKLNYTKKQIILFIKNQYPNVYSSSLILNKPNYQLNLINKSCAIVIHSNPSLEWHKYRNIYQIEYNSFKVNNNKLEQYMNKHINTINLKQFISKIFILDLFLQQNFFHLKNFLLVLQEAIVKKFKLNTLYFQLENSYFDLKFINSGILLIKKIVPNDNIEIPIILSYIKKSLTFNNRYQINYIFILIMDSNNLYKDKWIIPFLEKFVNIINIKFDNVKKLYEMIRDSIKV